MTKFKEFLMGFIISLVIGFIVAGFFNPTYSSLKEKFGSKPDIVTNIAITKNIIFANATTDDSLFYKSYGNTATWGMIKTRFQDLKEFEISSKYEKTFLPPSLECKTCADYYFAFKNIGKRKAEDVVFNIKSYSAPRFIIKPEKMIIDSSCEELISSEGCKLKFEDVEVGEEILFALGTYDGSSIFVDSCKSEDKYKCNLFYLEEFITWGIPKEEPFLTLGGKEIKFPTSDKIKKGWVCTVRIKDYQTKDDWICMES